MIRTDSVSPTLRIEITDREIIARDPDTDEVSKVAIDCSDARWNKVNRLVWNQLNSIREACRTDPGLSETSGAEFLCRIYRAGMSALLTLIGPQHAQQLDAIQEFFRKRIPSLPESKAEPPVIDLVSVIDHHFPLEMLPLLGKSSICDGTGKGTARDVADILPGYCAIIRRVPLTAVTVRGNGKGSEPFDCYQTVRGQSPLIVIKRGSALRGQSHLIVFKALCSSMRATAR